MSESGGTGRGTMFCSSSAMPYRRGVDGWGADDCRAFAAQHMSHMGQRWWHVQAVATHATNLGLGDSSVLGAAWVHDIGYADQFAGTGLHALDGARALALAGAPEQLVSLVAYHSGAEYEAEERSLGEELQKFDRPCQDDLDALILVDMTVGPAGEALTVGERLEDILRRYPAGDPVHEAVRRSAPYLRACATRAAGRLGLADVWNGPVAEIVGDA